MHQKRSSLSFSLVLEQVTMNRPRRHDHAIDMHFMEDEVDKHRLRREHDRTIENILEAIQAHEARQQYRWRGQLRRRAANRRRPGININQREGRHGTHVSNQRSRRNSRGSIGSRPMQRARITEHDQRMRETPRRDRAQQTRDLCHSLP